MPDQPAAVTRTYQLLLWMVPVVNKFRRDHRFTLGDRIINHLYDLLELLVEASYTRQKSDLLRRANLEVDLLRHLVRLSRDLGVLGVRQYEHGVRLLTDVGRQVGGWRRSRRGEAPPSEAARRPSEPGPAEGAS